MSGNRGPQSSTFGPISGFESKIKDPSMSHAVTTFCYGCNLGPMQTERSLPVLSRKHLEWINRRHITEEKLEKAINVLVNGYNQFSLPTYWGTGETASADGIRWDVSNNGCQNPTAEPLLREANNDCQNPTAEPLPR